MLMGLGGISATPPHLSKDVQRTLMEALNSLNMLQRRLPEHCTNGTAAGSCSWRPSAARRQQRQKPNTWSLDPKRGRSSLSVLPPTCLSSPVDRSRLGCHAFPESKCGEGEKGNEFALHIPV